MEPNTKRNQSGHIERRALTLAARPPAPNGREYQRRSQGAEEHQRVPLKRGWHQCRRLAGLDERADSQENQEADGEAQKEINPLPVDRPHKGEPEKTNEDRNHSSIHAEKSESREITRVRPG